LSPLKVTSMKELAHDFVAGHIHVQLAGTDAGMDDETRSKLFTMFYSAKGSLGTALGLLVAHKVATEHGGTIAVKPVPSQGSTFSVQFPLEAGGKESV
jgi:signal transduction histidine kinase